MGVMHTFEKAGFADLPEFGVGHFTNFEAMTGCTCFVARGACSDGVVCAVDVRGGGPATRETDLLRPENMVQKANAVMIGGGSAFGLEAACGAMETLADEGIGFSVGPATVPIVPAACLFDLLVGKPEWPSKEDGASACKAALAMSEDGLEQGSIGAGTGATIGKMGLPEQAAKSGFGWSGARMGGLVVISCVAVNALGNVIAEDGSWLAGVHDAEGNVLDPIDATGAAMADMAAAEAVVDKADTAAAEAMAATVAGNAGEGQPEPSGLTRNTTLGVVLTNASLSKAQATKVAQQAQDGYARAIKPVHTLNDGDTIFVMASGTMPESEGLPGGMLPDLVGMLAADTMEDAIRNAVKHA